MCRNTVWDAKRAIRDPWSATRVRHGCRGGGEGDAFIPAFFLTPLGAVATAFSLRSAMQQSWSWVFWPLAIIFAIVLLGAIAFIVLLVHQLASHHR